MNNNNNSIENICDLLSHSLLGIRNYAPKNESEYYDVLNENIGHIKSHLNLLKSGIYDNITTSTDNGIVLFVDILEICVNNMSKHLKTKQWELIREEADCNHNVPSIVASQNIDLIKFYFKVEHKCCIKNLPVSALKLYSPIWEKIRENYNITDSPTIS